MHYATGHLSNVIKNATKEDWNIERITSTVPTSSNAAYLAGCSLARSTIPSMHIPVHLSEVKTAQHSSRLIFAHFHMFPIPYPIQI